MIDAFAVVFDRDILKLGKEIEEYSSEVSLWIVKDGISNSGGNLCLHLLGNLNHFIGAGLGKTGYVRERDKEFSAKNVPKQELLKHIEETRKTVASVLGQLKEENLNDEFPFELMGKTWPVSFMLLHIATHLSYHIGQINYHRRLTSLS